MEFSIFSCQGNQVSCKVVNFLCSKHRESQTIWSLETLGIRLFFVFKNTTKFLSSFLSRHVWSQCSLFFNNSKIMRRQSQRMGVTQVAYLRTSIFFSMLTKTMSTWQRVLIRTLLYSRPDLWHSDKNKCHVSKQKTYYSKSIPSALWNYCESFSAAQTISNHWALKRQSLLCIYYILQSCRQGGDFNCKSSSAIFQYTVRRKSAARLGELKIHPGALLSRCMASFIKIAAAARPNNKIKKSLVQ